MPPKNRISSYRKTDLWDTKQMRTEIRKLDPDQRQVLDIYIKYARTYRLPEKRFCSFVSPAASTNYPRGCRKWQVRIN